MFAFVLNNEIMKPICAYLLCASKQWCISIGHEYDHCMTYIYMLLNLYRKIFGTSSYNVDALASASPPYERVPNILRYTFNNLFIIYPLNGYFTIDSAPIYNIQDHPAFHFA